MNPRRNGNEMTQIDPKPETAESRHGTGERIRLRSVILGILLALLICALTPFNNAYRQGTPLGGGYFPLAPFYILVWMMILTALLRAVFKKHRFLTGRSPKSDFFRASIS
jgi:hypothetical protein